MTQDRDFPQLVSVACHDLSTPLATVYGFARTLEQLELDGPAAGYVEIIEQASEQIKELVEQLRIVAQVEAGRYDPVLVEMDSLALAQAAAESLAEGRVTASGEGDVVRVEPRAATRAVAQLARAASRHGGHDTVSLDVRGAELAVSPLSPTAEPVVLGEQLLELGAAAGGVVIRALGGSLAVEDGRLLIRLPTPS
ncbi:MAG TPA: histidine kinase dimerization/phospho-acceptor domain-containing protein [Gaiellaceae bacterium]|nr:histidine kinase dimerization/phospho-acceptor domain-containing protein [Gaiellaceae bacterium]